MRIGCECNHQASVLIGHSLFLSIFGVIWYLLWALGCVARIFDFDDVFFCDLCLLVLVLFDSPSLAPEPAPS